MSSRTRTLVGVGLLLGAAVWWVLQPGPAPAPDRSDVAERAERTRAEVRKERARRQLPTRTEADEPALDPDDDGPLPPQNPHELPHVTCRLSESVPPSTGALYLQFGQARRRVGSATAAGTEVSFNVRGDDGQLMLHLPGHYPVALVWTTTDAGLTCAPDPLPILARADMTLTGTVHNTAGNPETDARLVGCGPGRIRDDGRFTVQPVNAPCTLQAVRQDGFWFSRSEVVDVPWVEGGSQHVELTLNEYPRGGMGMTIGGAVGGISVEGIEPDSPAAQAGLGAGDLVLAVDGQSTDGMGVREFVDLGTGEAGTDVTLEVLGADGNERTLTLTRAMLGP